MARPPRPLATTGMIGPLRHRLTLESVTVTRDEGGGAVESWDEIARLWGAITARDGSEPFTADARRPRGSHTITVRIWPGLAPGNRLRLDSRVFNILAVADVDGRGRFLDCDCLEQS